MFYCKESPHLYLLYSNGRRLIYTRSDYMSPTYEQLGSTTQATQDIYGILLKEYRRLSYFHNTILDG